MYTYLAAFNLYETIHCCEKQTIVKHEHSQPAIFPRKHPFENTSSNSLRDHVCHTLSCFFFRPGEGSPPERKSSSGSDDDFRSGCHSRVQTLYSICLFVYCWQDSVHDMLLHSTFNVSSNRLDFPKDQSPSRPAQFSPTCASRSVFAYIVYIILAPSSVFEARLEGKYMSHEPKKEAISRGRGEREKKRARRKARTCEEHLGSSFRATFCHADLFFLVPRLIARGSPRMSFLAGDRVRGFF